MVEYRTDFYTERNIIGYTGNIAEANTITVYFLKKYRFGRITQTHLRKNNIGRERVRVHLDYKIKNNDRLRCEEFYAGRIRHISRNAFHPVGQDELETLSILASIIRITPQCKPKHCSSFGSKMICCQ